MTTPPALPPTVRAPDDSSPTQPATLASLAAIVESLRGAVGDLAESVGALARDHAETAARVEEHAQRLAVRAFLASLPETAAVCGLVFLASRHAISGEAAAAAVLGVLGFRLAPGRVAGALSPTPPPKDPP